jgi:large subunit ribosomal protein L4
VLRPDDTNAWLSFRNLPEVHVISDGELNTYDVLVSDVVVFTQASLPSRTPSGAIRSEAAEAEVTQEVAS